MQEISKDGFLLTTDKSKLSLDTICGFLARSHWAANRKRSTVAKSIENSLCYGVFFNGRQVAFARLVTDYSTYAYLCDVFVDEEFRGQGLSKWMMEAIMSNPELSELRRFTLFTKDAHGLYAKFGFQPLSAEENRRFMSILKEGV
ncbi:MAG: GNAT family N-acetyltransferase [Bdellovibrionales bacterium]|nr:GNAT family N-acetyltransferase [Bdellovibrionales bacterium]